MFARAAAAGAGDEDDLPQITVSDISKTKVGMSRPARRRPMGFLSRAVVYYAMGFLLFLVVTLVLMEILLLVAVLAGPAVQISHQLLVLLENVNGLHLGTGGLLDGAALAITVNEYTPASLPAASATDSTNGTDAFIAWCEDNASLQAFNCTDLDAGLNDGVDAATGVPNLPFSADFCATAQTLNDALVFCAASLEARPFPPSGQGLLDNLEFVRLLCEDFGPLNDGDRGNCTGSK